MNTPRGLTLARLTSIVESYRGDGNVPRLLDDLAALADQAPTDELFEAADAYAAVPEVLGPLMEVVVARVNRAMSAPSCAWPTHTG